MNSLTHSTQLALISAFFILVYTEALLLIGRIIKTDISLWVLLDVGEITTSRYTVTLRPISLVGGFG